jgi:hypothetical protein
MPYYTISRAIAKGSEKTWDEFLSANPERAIDDVTNSYIKLIDEQSPWPEGFDWWGNANTI